MPSIKTRIAYQNMALAQSEQALAEAAAAVSSATQQLEDLQDGTLEVEAITVGGQRFTNQGGVLQPEP